MSICVVSGSDKSGSSSFTFELGLPLDWCSNKQRQSHVRRMTSHMTFGIINQLAIFRMASQEYKHQTQVLASLDGHNILTAQL
jgi:hypothetical protein